MESKWAKKRQHGPKKVLKSFKVPKSSICKKGSLMGAQDEHKRFKTALKRHLKGFKTRKNKSKTSSYSIFWTIFRTDLGSRIDPEINQK